MDKMILVTGAGGQVGKHVLQALSAKGIRIQSKQNKDAVLSRFVNIFQSLGKILKLR